MSYNIDTITIVEGQLQMTPLGMKRALLAWKEAEGCLPEMARDCLYSPEYYLKDYVIKKLPCTGEGSGRALAAFKEHFLARCDGDAKLLLCWEGGDSYTGLVVSDGVVTEGRVVHTVVPK